MSIRSRWLISASILVLIAAFFVPRASIPTAYAAAPSLYTMTSFSNSSEANMYVYLSNDGLNFTRVGTAPTYTPPSGIIRDPSVTVSGGRYKEAGQGVSFSAGSHYTLVNRNCGRVLDISGGSTANGATAIQYSNHHGTNQQWSIAADAAGYYKLVNVNSGKDLEVSNSSTANGGTVDQWASTGAANQEWNVVPIGGGYYELVNRNSGDLLSVNGGSTANGASVVQEIDQYGTSQQWSIVLA